MIIVRNFEIWRLSICWLQLGMRIGEMVLLNKVDINFNERECVVFGKGDKERVVYFRRQD